MYSLLKSRKRRFIIICFFFAFGFYAALWNTKLRRSLPPRFRAWSGGDLPGPGPDYERFREAERALPQHDLLLPYPEGKRGKYVKFTTQIVALGWNNVFNELLLCSHLAWRAKRSYVFQDYTWKPEYYPWRIREFPWPRNPLTTLVAGPTAGGPWESTSNPVDSPRSISSEWFDVVCPPEEREYIDSDVAKEPVRNADGKTVMDHWVKLLSASDARCIEVVPTKKKTDNFPQVFDLWMIGDGRLLTVWEEFKSSPISRLLKASPLVLSAVAQNEHLFIPPDSFSNLSYTPYNHMLAVHIRRGDYLDACSGLANWNSTFYGWNLLPELPDPFHNPTAPFTPGNAPPEVHALYNERCLPTNDYILRKIRESKAAWEKNAPPGSTRKLEVLFIMTNAKEKWIEEFKRSLRKEDADWKQIVTTKDLRFDPEQMGVNMAVDMELARRAAVYIGNGWSSMTSNILHQRLVDNKEPLSNRFW